MRYLVVMDDIWHIENWNDSKKYFPNDNNGSRIMFTSRMSGMASQAKPESPHFLHFLTEDESWDLLRQKIFGEKNCPSELVEIGKQIAKTCQGLPLAIVVVAGLLAKTDKTKRWWKQVAQSASSYIISDPNQYMDTLALSYNHLPPQLKACFLFMGAFLEDYEIPVQKLIWLWVAEGFIHQTGQKSLEDVAEEYLMDLIDQNLVLVAKKGSAGRLKACHIHDLLRDLCLRKVEEDNFIEIYCHEQLLTFFLQVIEQIRNIVFVFILPCTIPEVLEHIALHRFAPHVRSFLCFASKLVDVSFIHQFFKLLRVLDLSPIKIFRIPTEISSLVLLRYLAVQTDDDKSCLQHFLPNSISKLWNLETLIVLGEMSFNPNILEGLYDWEYHDILEDTIEPGVLYVPPTIWKMVKLRHIRIPQGSYTTKNVYPSILDNLQTISQICPTKSFEDVLARTPNLKKLGLCGDLISELTRCFHLTFPDLTSLNHLETLKLSTLMNRQYFSSGPLNHHKPCFLQWEKFPPNLKKITLEDTCLARKEMSIYTWNVTQS